MREKVVAKRKEEKEERVINAWNFNLAPKVVVLAEGCASVSMVCALML